MQAAVLRSSEARQVLLYKSHYGIIHKQSIPPLCGNVNALPVTIHGTIGFTVSYPPTGRQTGGEEGGAVSVTATTRWRCA